MYLDIEDKVITEVRVETDVIHLFTDPNTSPADKVRMLGKSEYEFHRYGQRFLFSLVNPNRKAYFDSVARMGSGYQRSLTLRRMPLVLSRCCF
jgi:hypothetical protein